MTQITAENMADTSLTSKWNQDNLLSFIHVLIRQHNTVITTQKSIYSQEFMYVVSHRFTTPIYYANQQTVRDKTIEPLIMFSSSNTISFQLCHSSSV
jgi:hypothetical protein